ncbi:peroxiredoxin family protein [Rhodopirellula sp. SWK7]|uniref:peroxiredoxin family protein n=1 Tax=Rhodopirellula sp. SWK7 TaxID=595460 RepID=UPI0002BEED2C|nr:secreted protein [Rhodopirellula sp. SWK7]EMI42441.1 secreted protein [Rhodopirellula sp. SWK7]
MIKSIPWMMLFLSTCFPVHPTQAQERGATSHYGSSRGGVLRDTALPDLDAHSAEGEAIKLRELCKGKYTVLAAGCLTCPQFHRGYPEIEAASKDYSPRGVQFFYFYKSLRHPELNGYVEAQNTSERLLQLAEARKMLGTEVPWIADTIDNSIRDGLNSANNSMFLISPEGQIVFASEHLDGPSLRQALTKYIGEVGHPTQAADMNLPRIARAKQPANVDSDILVSRPDGLVILTATPKNPSETYYVKMRAEADADLLRTGNGRLFLGFYPDPIHGVHWNNLTKPMKYSLTLPAGVQANPAEASAQPGPGNSDTHPRQFWVDIKSDSPSASFELAMHYFGCTDTMCESLTQEYTIHLTPADMGSSTFGFNRGPGGSGRGQGGQRAQGSQRGQRGQVTRRGQGSRQRQGNQQELGRGRSDGGGRGVN